MFADFFSLDKLAAGFFIRLLIDFISVLVLVRFIYFPNYKKHEFLFTCFLFNLVIFIITYLLNRVEMSLGAAFGLFAVFSILRYRTENISAKEMTYIFTVIAMGLISAVSRTSYFELILLNFIMVGFSFVLDGNIISRKESSQRIIYEKIDLITPEKRELLLADLRERTGLNIHRISIENIDFLKDTVLIIAYFYDERK